MNKKNEKRLCWNCEGSISLHLIHCLYCGADLTQSPAHEGDRSHFERRGEIGSPFQSSAQRSVPTPPYARMTPENFSVSEEEWKQTMDEEKTTSPKEEAPPATLIKKEMGALLLLLPGIAFLLFGLALIFFSHDGVLSLRWNQHFAYYYFFGSVPLLLLGWRILK